MMKALGDFATSCTLPMWQRLITSSCISLTWPSKNTVRNTVETMEENGLPRTLSSIYKLRMVVKRRVGAFKRSTT